MAQKQTNVKTNKTLVYKYMYSFFFFGIFTRTLNIYSNWIWRNDAVINRTSVATSTL